MVKKEVIIAAVGNQTNREEGGRVYALPLCSHSKSTGIIENISFFTVEGLPYMVTYFLRQ